MGITGLYIDVKNINNTDINLINKNTNAYYVIDNINFVHHSIDSDTLSSTDNYFSEKMYIYTTINIYNTKVDREERLNLLDTFYYHKEIPKNTNFNNLWETLYIEIKNYLINYYQNTFIELLNINTLDDLPSDYKNIITFTNT